MATTTIGLKLYLDVAPRPGQTPQQAADELAETLAKYLTDKDGALYEDFGAHPEDIEHWQNHPDEEPPNWGGYEGPFWTRAAVLRQDSPNKRATLIAESKL